ncbi:hypothetical protein LINPERPRIM_LOCUS695, partial [Linum perenne]
DSARSLFLLLLHCFFHSSEHSSTDHRHQHHLHNGCNHDKSIIMISYQNSGMMHYQNSERKHLFPESWQQYIS